MKAQLAEMRDMTDALFAVQASQPGATLAELKNSLGQILDRKDQLNQKANVRHPAR